MNLLFVRMMNKNPIVSSYGNQIYFIDGSGLYHCEHEGLPAFFCYAKGREYYLYYNHGKFHNLNGPACVYMDARIEDQYWVDDARYKCKESWEMRVKQYKRTYES